ncbi:MAG TPA: hypothetical protein GXX29_06465 [Firmicutes bacterium]|nr:hypothetical protein [Bacillota bacterium]
MKNFSHRGDWFKNGMDPTGWLDADADDDTDADAGFIEQEFEYTLKFPLPADKVVQSMKMVKGRLIVTYQFVFTDPLLFEDEED